MATKTKADRCEATTVGGGYNPRTYRCQKETGHEGQCSYYRPGGQGGSTQRWWGANQRPIDDIDGLGHLGMAAEIQRLRDLCDQAGIDWIEGLT